MPRLFEKMWGFLSRHTDALQCDSGKDADAEGELATHLLMYKRGNSHAFLGSGAAAAKPAAPRLYHLDVGTSFLGAGGG